MKQASAVEALLKSRGGGPFKFSDLKFLGPRVRHSNCRALERDDSSC